MVAPSTSTIPMMLARRAAEGEGVGESMQLTQKEVVGKRLLRVYYFSIRLDKNLRKYP